MDASKDPKPKPTPPPGMTQEQRIVAGVAAAALIAYGVSLAERERSGVAVAAFLLAALIFGFAAVFRLLPSSIKLGEAEASLIQAVEQTQETVEKLSEIVVHDLGRDDDLPLSISASPTGPGPTSQSALDVQVEAVRYEAALGRALGDLAAAAVPPVTLFREPTGGGRRFDYALRLSGDKGAPLIAVEAKSGAVRQRALYRNWLAGLVSDPANDKFEHIFVVTDAELGNLAAEFVDTEDRLTVLQWMPTGNLWDLRPIIHRVIHGGSGRT